jgi:hypothetical protein
LSDDSRIPLKSLIEAWKIKCGEVRLGDGGTPYVMIPSSRMMESLKILAKTLKSSGFTYDEIDSPIVNQAIVEKCWRENVIRKMSLVQIRRAKENLSDLWNETIHSSEFSGIVISTLEENEKIVPVEKPEPKVKAKVEKTQEELMEEIFNSKDRIIGKEIDRSDCVNWELLKELGIDLDKAENE